ncbi:MAG: rod-binding protein [Alphaproteobacteria bacterium]|nr:rod-binding protein [Alphaproteobacteria bacterium]
MTQILPAKDMAQAAQAFEANALGELFQPMFDTVDTSDGLFGGGIGESTFRPMLTHAIAEAVAAHGGLGLAAPVMQQMLRMQETVKSQ